jgi:hypothetical protein
MFKNLIIHQLGLGDHANKPQTPDILSRRSRHFDLFRVDLAFELLVNDLLQSTPSMHYAYVALPHDFFMVLDYFLVHFDRLASV